MIDTLMFRAAAQITLSYTPSEEAGLLTHWCFAPRPISHCLTHPVKKLDYWRI